MPTLPEVDELVLATVKKILPYGAFCSLDEYSGQEAFLHISEVAPRWIKNIREFLHENQHLVAKVHNVIPEKGQVDISLKRLTEAERKRKLESVRHEKRSEKLFDVAIKHAKSTTQESMAAKRALEEKYGDMLIAFEKISEDGEGAISGLKIEKGLAASLLLVAQKSIRKSKAILRTVASITSYAPDGVLRVQSALSVLKAPEGGELEIHYLGAPRYQLSVSAKDFKDARKALEGMKEALEEKAKKEDMAVSFADIEE
jgi:translation initiation factor 2 subunit 1